MRGWLGLVLALGCAAIHAEEDERARDLRMLLDGVAKIAAPGVPGDVCAFGPAAFPVVVGATGDKMVAPAVVAGRLGKGRVVAFGHSGYLGAPAVADTRRFLRNALRWAAGGKEPARVGVRGCPDLLDFLRAEGVKAEPLDGTDWTGRLDDFAVLCSNSEAAAGPEEIAALRTAIERGRGWVTAATGWGWLQLNPGRTLVADHQGNRVLAPAGIAWGNGYLERTCDEGFTATVPPALAHAGAALDALLAGAAGDSAEQAAVTVIAAARQLPADDRLLAPRLAKLREHARVPTPERPLARAEALARLGCALDLLADERTPPDRVRAHPAAAAFPGALPASAPRLRDERRQIDTSIPGWHGLGLYAPAGEPLAVALPEAAAGRGLSLRIGPHTDELWHCDAWTRCPVVTRTVPLSGAATPAASAFGGLVYVEVPDPCALGEVEVRVSGAVAAPWFRRGKTTPAEWRSRRSLPAPWAELAGDRVVLTVPARVVRQLADPGPLLAFWDRVLDADADLAGIPHERRRPERICLDQQISAGYMHSGYPIMTHLDVAELAVDLARLSTMGAEPVWGFFHELGHNHQSGDWTFDGTGEVTCNLFTLYALDTVCGVPPARARDVLAPAALRARFDAHVAKGAPFEEWKEDPFLALLMYVQLQQAFGWDVYRRVFAEYRALGEGDRPKSDEDKRDQWLVRFSRSAGRNLGPFFRTWGLPTSDSARAAIADLPEWMPEERGGK